MKKLVLMTILLAGILSLSLNSVTANVPYAPDLPALPEDDFLCGDVNEDGVVNVLDIISMVNYILGGTVDPFNLDAADINADDAINVLDIIGIVNIILQTPGIPCPCVPSVTYEGQTYNTVKIGDQCWFKENLNVGIRINGSNDQANNDIIEKYCYDDLESNCDAYGGLYQLFEAMDYTTTEGAQGICPNGWHIATDEEWKILEGIVDSNFPVGDPEWDDTGWRGYDAGKNLKSTSGWNSGGNGTDQYGFTALPGGSRDADGTSFDNLGDVADFWSSTEDGNWTAWARYLHYTLDDVYRSHQYYTYGFSIRCLKDN